MTEGLAVVDRDVEIEREPLGLTVDVRVRIADGLTLPLTVGLRVGFPLAVPEPVVVDVRVAVTVRDSVGLALVVGVLVCRTVPVAETEMVGVADAPVVRVGETDCVREGRELTLVVTVAVVDAELIVVRLTEAVVEALRDPLPDAVLDLLWRIVCDPVADCDDVLVAVREVESDAAAVAVLEALAVSVLVRVGSSVRVAAADVVLVRVAVAVADVVVDPLLVRLDVAVREPVEVPDPVGVGRRDGVCDDDVDEVRVDSSLRVADAVAEDERVVRAEPDSVAVDEGVLDSREVLDDVALAVVVLLTDDVAVPERVLVADRVEVVLPVLVRDDVLVLVAIAEAVEDLEVVAVRVDVSDAGGVQEASADRVLIDDACAERVLEPVRVAVRVDVAVSVGITPHSARRRSPHVVSYWRATNSVLGAAATPLSNPSPPGENDIRLRSNSKRRILSWILKISISCQHQNGVHHGHTILVLKKTLMQLTLSAACLRSDPGHRARSADCSR